MRAHPESDLHSEVAKLLAKYERLGLLVYCPVPNGVSLGGPLSTRARHIATLKRKGQFRPGVSDILLCLKGGRFAAIELKARKNDLTVEQAAFLDLVELAGGLTAVCRSLIEVQGTLSAWLGSAVRRAAA